MIHTTEIVRLQVLIQYGLTCFRKSKDVSMTVLGCGKEEHGRKSDQTFKGKPDQEDHLQSVGVYSKRDAKIIVRFEQEE
jgi:hypothetical protein